MISEIILNFKENSSFFIELIVAHVQITFISAILATIIGLIIGIIISENKKIANTVISFVNILYTIPSIALLGALISFTGIGNTTAIIALSIYALLPIVRSVYTGINGIDANIIEASEAMGSKKSQILYKIKLPLAFPIIFSAIRNMVTMTIALAGIASFVGAGGLGVAIYRGITTNNKTLILCGSMLIAFLALFFDFILGIFEKSVVNKRKKYKTHKYIVISTICVIVLILANMTSSYFSSKHTIKIASKPTTENYILADIVGTLITEKTNLKVDITYGVGGGTSNIHPAMVKSEFDMYPEYTGTSWQIVLKEKEQYLDDKFEELNKKYEKNYNLTWKSMFGFNDTYGIAVHKDIAQKYNLKTYTDLAKYSKDLIFGAEYDFFEREDGFDSLSKAYNLTFKKNIDMDNGLKYQALLDKKIDVMTVFTTDGQLSNPNLVVLEDNLKFYPSYMAGMVVNMDTLQKKPELEDILKQLENMIDEKEMAKMNYEVEVSGKKTQDVAQEFLKKKGII